MNKQYGIKTSKNTWVRNLQETLTNDPNSNIIKFDTKTDAMEYAEALELSNFKVKKVK